MRTNRFILAALFLIVACRSAAGEVIAHVNGRAITRTEFGDVLVQTLGPWAMGEYVDRVLVEQEARRRGITASEARTAERTALEVELRVRAVRRDLRLGPGEFIATLRNNGRDPADLREELRRSVSRTEVRLKLLRDQILEPRIDLSEQTLRRYWERTRGRRYAGAHIAVLRREDAEKLVEALQENPDLWGLAVRRYSQDRASVSHKGRIGPVPADSDLGRALDGMVPGELKVHKGDQFWHVLRFIKTIPAEETPFEEVREDVRREWLASRAGELHYELLAELNARADVVANLAGDPETRRILGRDVAAYVNGEAVPVRQLGKALIEEFGPTMLKGYVERLLVFQEAEERGVAVTEEELQERMDAVTDQVFRQYADRRGMTEQEMAELLDDRGLNLDRSKELLARRLVDPDDVRATLLAEKMVAEGVEVTNQDVQAAYAEHYGERFEVREMTAQSLAQAQDLYQKLLQGATFELIMRAEAGESGAWLEGLAPLTVTESHPHYPYVKELEEGQVSGIFEHDGRYHIIKVIRHHSPAERPPLESVREELERRVRRRKLRERVRALLVKLRAEADIRVSLDQPEDEAQVRQPGG